MKLDSERKEQP